MTEKPTTLRLVKATQTPPPPTVFPGDQIEISVSAQVRINGDENWIKFGVTSKVGEDETGEEAYKRVLEFSKASFTTTVEATAAHILTMGD